MVVVGGWSSWIGRGDQAQSAAPLVTVALVGLGLYVGAWSLGFALRVRTRELRARRLLHSTEEQLGAVEVELLMAQERDRIARDVHDVLAHSLAVVIAQADGARFLGAGKGEVADAAFRTIADAARSALVDVRTLIEGLREDPGDQPQPGLAEIRPLLSQLDAAGMHVESTTFGTAKTMTPAQELAVYRIVQESLTNALRHAGHGARTRLSLDWRGPGLAVSITSTGGEAGESSETPGHGIRGMKDRARLAGGWLTAGSADEGDFVVSAFIPSGSEPHERPAVGDGGATELLA
jgi:signal transduction histidine kinase